MQAEKISYSLVRNEVNPESLLSDRKRSLCFLVDRAGLISRHARDKGCIDSTVTNLNVVRGNGDVEAYFRRQLLGCAQLYDDVRFYIHERHEETFRNVVLSVGLNPERVYN